jgi:hypothetical protein
VFWKIAKLANFRREIGALHDGIFQLLEKELKEELFDFNLNKENPKFDERFARYSQFSDACFGKSENWLILGAKLGHFPTEFSNF